MHFHPVLFAQTHCPDRGRLVYLIMNCKKIFGFPEKKGADNHAVSVMRKLFGSSFVELGAYRGERDENGKPSLCNTVTGYGAVNDALVYAFVQDGSDNGGAVSAVSARKIVSLIERSCKDEAPLVGFFDSRGAQIEDGMSALAGYGRIMRAVAAKHGNGPSIAVISGHCTGGLAVIAEMFDIVIALDGTDFYLNPTYIARDALARQGIAAPEIGTAAAAAMRGELSLVCKNIDEAIAALSELIGYIAYPEGEASDSCDRTTDSIAGIMSKPEYDVHAVIKELCDNGNYLECKPGYASELITAFGRICGDTVAIVASNPAHHGGHLSERAAGKASAFMIVASLVRIPVVTLVDTVGFDTTAPTELECTASRMAELALLYADTPNAHITVVTGRAYGTASVILGSRSLGADICLALEYADMSIIDPNTAVQFMYGDEIDSSSDPEKTRAERIKEWKEAHAGTAEAAMYGEIDDVIPHAELRARIAAAVKECK